MAIEMGTSTVEERGMILIPKEIRKRTGLRSGEKVRVETRDNTILDRYGRWKR